MTEQEETRLMGRMAEAAMLTQADPHRLQVIEEVSQVGAWARQYWLELNQEEESLRLAMRDLAPPGQLLQRLHRLPEAGHRRRPNVRLWIAMSGLAAILVLSIFAWMALPDGGRIDTRPFREVANELTRHHRQAHPRMPTLSPEAMKFVQNNLPFPMHTPDRLNNSRLLGFHAHHVGEIRAICSRWLRNNKICTVFQMPSKELDAPREFADQTMASGSEPVTIWKERQYVYAMTSSPTEQAVALSLRDD